MLSFFKSNNPAVVLFYIVYLLLFRICLYFTGADTAFVFDYHEPLSAVFFGWLVKLPINFTISGAVLSIAITFLQAVLVNRMVNENKMISRKNYLPGLIFIIYASFLPQNLLINPACIALTFIILATSNIFALVKKEKAYGLVFDVGLLVALAALFYFPCVVLVVFAYIGLATVRSFSYKEWAALLMGFLSPLLLVFTWYFYTGIAPQSMLPAAMLPGLFFTPIQWGTIAALLLCAMVSFLLLPGVLYSSLIQVRKFTTLLAVLFFFICGSFFLQQIVSISHLVFLSLPVGIITAMVLFQIKNKLVPEVIHLILILLVLAGQYLPVLHLI